MVSKIKTLRFFNPKNFITFPSSKNIFISLLYLFVILIPFIPIIDGISFFLLITWLVSHNLKKLSLKNDLLFISLTILSIVFILSLLGNYSYINKTGNTFLAIKNLLGDLGPIILFIIVAKTPLQEGSIKKLIEIFTLAITFYTVLFLVIDWFPSLNHRFNLGIHPNASGGLIGLALIFFIIRLLECKNKPILFKGISFGIILLSAALILTFSRGVWLGIPIVITVVLIMMNKKKQVVFTIAGLAVLLIILFETYPGFWDRFASIFSISKNYGRLVIWNNSFLIFKKHFLIGVGPGMFAHHFYNLVPNFPELHHRHAHNNFIQIAVEFGIIGLTAFILMLAAVFKKVLVFLKHFKGSPLETLSLTLLAWFIFWFILGLSDYSYNLTFKPIIYMLMLLLALLSSKSNLEKQERHENINN